MTKKNGIMDNGQHFQSVTGKLLEVIDDIIFQSLTGKFSGQDIYIKDNFIADYDN